MQGRSFVTPQDVKDVGLDVLRHRIIPTYEAEAENVTTDELVRRIFERVDVP
jgi:MoxR-like ATPase